jgi:hypothetical protein
MKTDHMDSSMMVQAIDALERDVDAAMARVNRLEGQVRVAVAVLDSIKPGDGPALVRGAVRAARQVLTNELPE